MSHYFWENENNIPSSEWAQSNIEDFHPDQASSKSPHPFDVQHVAYAGSWTSESTVKERPGMKNFQAEHVIPGYSYYNDAQHVTLTVSQDSASMVGRQPDMDYCHQEDAFSDSAYPPDGKSYHAASLNSYSTVIFTDQQPGHILGYGEVERITYGTTALPPPPPPQHARRGPRRCNVCECIVRGLPDRLLCAHCLSGSQRPENVKWDRFVNINSSASSDTSEVIGYPETKHFSEQEWDDQASLTMEPVVHSGFLA
ncbi:hypothetical protein BCR34DRAFT_114367 [Clohesyomyces aquaticus]|uniref:Uncharacterized protein n=1 Tax=Clohesyomyces aquaticus TaxID=1231657 RepID=A0A1Y1YQI5_9PLEO|nr:hypothetical protein BCR34DRAFT_114367 [Clohesyomyces aquaticus]